MLNSAPGRVSLKRRVFEAGAWSAGGYALAQVLRFGTNLLMTRLLTPDLFGLMAIAQIVLTGLTMLSDLGIRQSIVRSNRGNDPAFVNTAWVMQNIRGVVLCVVALSIGLLLALAQHAGWTPKDSVYSDGRLPYVIAALSSVALVGGLTSTKIFEESRNLTIYRVTRIELVSQIAGLSFMLAWVTFDRSIWALVGGGICSAVVRMVLSHVWLHGTNNRWQWDNAAFRELTSFGKWILGASVLGFLASNTDRLLLGGLVDPTLLGMYVIAFLIFSVVEQVLAKLMVDVTFPALSEVARAKPHDLKVNYYRFHAVIGAFAYLSAGILMISGDALISLIYDARYHQAGWMLQILAIALITVPLGVAARFFVIVGMPERLFQIGAVRLVTLIIATLGGFHFFGMTGAVVGIALSFFAPAPVTIFYQIKLGVFDTARELLTLLVVFAGMGIGWLLNVIIRHL
jgi:O-antigen/teichoic acid export membrane protein